MPTASGHTDAIRTTKVIGTSVFNPGGQRIGKIEDVVLDKTSNNIMFAVVGFGGFLGMNEKFHPCPGHRSIIKKAKMAMLLVIPKTNSKLDLPKPLTS